MSSHYVSSLLAGRPSDDQATTDFDDFNLVESTDMVDSGGGLSGENKRRFLSVLIDAASSSSNGAASLSPVNASFAIRCISGAMVDQGLVCGGIIFLNRIATLQSTRRLRTLFRMESIST